MAKFKRLAEASGEPAFPKQQLLILALCRICEPIAFMSIFPYIYYMIESFNITSDPSQISFYAGLVTSAFTFAEFSTGVLWGRLSDKVGRKPVLLTGLAGTGVSMLMFGFASNLPVALLARALGGLLNGNIGVLQTTVGELVTVKSHQPRAYTIMPFVWCLGSIIGPSLGGALAQPCVSYPSLFPPGTMFEAFPYLLPNLLCTAFVITSLVVGILFLEETHAEKKMERDRGLECGRWIVDRVRRVVGLEVWKPSTTEAQILIGDVEHLPAYRATDSPVHHLDSKEMSEIGFNASKPASSCSRAFPTQVILIITGYGVLAYHTITLDQLLPVLLSTPNNTDLDSMSLPLKFVGGFGLTTKEIGVILSMQGVYSMIATLFFFPHVIRRLGALPLFRLLAFTYPVLYLAVPYLVLLPANLRIVGVYCVIVWKCTFANFAFPANAILLRNAAPSLLLLGTINGVAASTASLCRALGPTISGYLYSLGLRIGYAGLPWWCTAFVAVLGGVLSFYMEEKRTILDEKVDEESCDLEGSRVLESPLTA